MASYTVAIIGTSGTGKTAFVRRCATGKFNPAHIATVRCARSTLRLYTTGGNFDFYLNDYAGKDIFSERIPTADAAIVMTDYSESAASLELTVRKARTFKHVSVCCSKSDRGVKTGCDIYLSSKTGKNVLEPFLRIAKALSGNDSLRLRPKSLEAIAARIYKRYKLLDGLRGSAEYLSRFVSLTN